MGGTIFNIRKWNEEMHEELKFKRGDVLPDFADPKMVQKFRAFIKRESTKLSEKDKEEIKALERKASALWKLGVKERAGGRCELPDCKKNKFLNAHHIESFTTNKWLRYDLENGICLCPSHHKFNRQSAHRSFCFMYKLLTTFRPKSLAYLLEQHNVPNPITKEILEDIVKQLSIFEKKEENKGK